MDKAWLDCEGGFEAEDQGFERRPWLIGGISKVKEKANILCFCF
jgi:hypothetical protein